MRDRGGARMTPEEYEVLFGERVHEASSAPIPASPVSTPPTSDDYEALFGDSLPQEPASPSPQPSPLPSPQPQPAASPSDDEYSFRLEPPPKPAWAVPREAPEKVDELNSPLASLVDHRIPDHQPAAAVEVAPIADAKLSATEKRSALLATGSFLFFAVAFAAVLIAFVGRGDDPSDVATQSLAQPAPTTTMPAQSVDAEAEARTTNVAPSTTLAQVEQTTTPRAENPISVLGTIEGASLCQDASDDFEISTFFPEAGIVTPGFLDLREARLEVNSSEVVVRWTMGGDIPANLGEPGVSLVEFASFSATLWAGDPAFLPEGEAFRRLLLSVNFWPEGVQVGHEADGTTSFASAFQEEGSFELVGNEAIARFNISDLSEMLADFAWEARVEASVLAEPSDVNLFSISNDSACPALAEGGQQFSLG